MVAGVPAQSDGLAAQAALLYNRRRFGFQRVIIDVPHYLRR